MGAGNPFDPSRVTEVLEELRRGAPGAQAELFRLVYGELKRLASAQMRAQPPGHTLQPTALVNEAYLRLIGGSQAEYKDRSHFFATAARAMRSILVDFARAKAAQKRGGGRRRITFDEGAHAGQHADEEIIAVHDALEKLEELDGHKARVVELRFFGGLTLEETAEVLGTNISDIHRTWELARTWLFREIGP